MRKPQPKGFYKIPVRTHLITEKDNIMELIKKYCARISGTGDIICLAETVVAITQGRAILPQDVRAGKLASFLSRFPAKGGSLATPPAMQLALEEVGPIRLLAGCLAAAVGKLIRIKGLFYIVAGRRLALIDDIAGTMHPYERHIVMGPKEPTKIVKEIKKKTGAEAAIVDVNDIGCVDILAISSRHYSKLVKEALQDNPFGNEDEQTPLVIIKRRRLIC